MTVMPRWMGDRPDGQVSRHWALPAAHPWDEMAGGPMDRIAVLLLDARSELGWQRRAACLEIGVGLFFPADDEDGEKDTAGFQAAKQVCQGCPVAAACLDFAETVEARMSSNDIHGVYGGKSANERIRMRRESQRQQPQRAAA